MTQTILNGGTKTTQDQYTGPVNELSVDESNRNLRLHDGVTPGGHTFLNRDNSDARYQARSTELDGIVGFEPQQRGILTRLGPADYRLRTIDVDPANLYVQNANGYTGNPTFGLAPTISSEHTWTGQHLFQDVVQFDAGINADVSGNLTGDVVGNVTGDVVGDLTGNANGNHTGSFTGNGNFAGKTVVFDDGQIPVAKVGGLLAYILANAFPIGGIIMWSGNHTNIPAGWTLCDGTSGAPDLRDRFVVGAGIGNTTFDSHDQGGAFTHLHSVVVQNGGGHLHGVTVDGHTLTESQIPSHRHLNGVVDKNASLYNHGSATATPSMPSSIDGNSSAGIVEGYTTFTGGGLPHAHTAATDSQGVHTHATTVSDQSHLPPYYALCFIMRTA